jgi:excisionase family DNA binding protein
VENPFQILEDKINQLTEMVSELMKKLDGKSMPDNKPLNIDEASMYLDIAKQTIYSLTSKREIPHFKTGKKLYFVKSELDLWLQSHRKKTVREIVKEK